MIALDTNLLVYAHRSQTAEHARAREAIERAAAADDGWGIPLPCLAEFWSVVTHPRAAGRPSNPEEAAGFIRALVQAGATLWEPQPGFASRLLAAAQQAGTAGARVFDLQIALVAREAGARELWSHDRNFQSLPGLPVYDPIA